MLEEPIFMNVQKRFIAGAVCPKCQLMDKIVVYSLAGKEFAECVHCHFRQEAKDEKKQSTAENANRKVIWLKTE